MKNLIVIGNDTDKISLEIWKGNTNYTVINKNPYIWGKDFVKYIKDRQVIVSTTSEQFETKEINAFIDYMNKHQFIPIFIADNDKSFEQQMFSAINEFIPSALLWTRNKGNKDYKTLIDIAQGYLIGKGIIEYDTTVRTPKKRKRTTTKK